MQLAVPMPCPVPALPCPVMPCPNLFTAHRGMRLPSSVPCKSRSTCHLFPLCSLPTEDCCLAKAEQGRLQRVYSLTYTLPASLLYFVPSSLFTAAEAIVAQGGRTGEVTSASMSVSLGQGVTVAAAVMTTGGNADSALADVLDRVVPAPTSRWAAMVEDVPPAVRYMYS